MFGQVFTIAFRPLNSCYVRAIGMGYRGVLSIQFKGAGPFRCQLRSVVGRFYMNGIGSGYVDLFHGNTRWSTVFFCVFGMQRRMIQGGGVRFVGETNICL